jgi:PAS domain S-box-containing protein
LIPSGDRRERVATVAQGVGQEAAELLEILSMTADGMVAIDPAMRIVGWNEAATDLLGYSAGEVMGLPCFEILGWHDRCGNGVCEADCPARARISRDELIETHEVMGRAKSGRSVWLSVSTVVFPSRLRADCQMVHLIREGGLPPQLERILVERLQTTRIPRGEDGERAKLETLSLREREVLRLLAEGLDTQGIAARLVIAPTTVRNHVQHILAKLDAHSRLEAVALVLRSAD